MDKMRLRVPMMGTVLASKAIQPFFRVSFLCCSDMYKLRLKALKA